jgi:hypothetical protein
MMIVYNALALQAGVPMDAKGDALPGLESGRVFYADV